jgi:predicted phosphoribosyltransferase
VKENEKEVLEKLAGAINNLSAEKQNYVLGIAEGMVISKESEKKNEE